LESESKNDAIKELIRKAPALTGICNRDRLEEAVIARENIQSTACGHGIAFAHGKTDQVDDIAIVLGISKKGIRFSTPDGGPVHLLFIIASPASDHRHYLMVLSSLARICYDRRFVREIVDKLSLKQIEKKLSKRLQENLTIYRQKISGLNGGYGTASAI
jgi:PTS system nitrogen regulatory IIA component